MTDPNLPRKQHPTVEETPYSVEDTGIASEEKIDRLLATAVAVREELIARSRKIAKWIIGLGTVMAIVLGFAGGVLWGLRGIAEQNRENGKIARANSEAILAATGPEANARGNARLAGAINELGRVGVCAAFYVVKEYPPACKDVTANMDRMRAGEPYSR